MVEEEERASVKVREFRLGGDRAPTPCLIESSQQRALPHFTQFAVYFLNVFGFIYSKELTASLRYAIGTHPLRLMVTPNIASRKYFKVLY